MQRILLLEGKRALTDAVKSVLDDRFPEHHIDFMLTSQVPEQFEQIDWASYDFVLVNCPFSLDPSLQRLCEIKQFPNSPIILVLSRSESIGQSAILAGADDFFYYDDSVSELAAKLEAQIELQDYIQHYPLKLSNCKIHDVIHDADNAVIYRASMLPHGKLVAIKRFKYDLLSLPQQTIEKLSNSLTKKMAVKHSGVVSIEKAGMTEEAFYLVMEYVPGADLKHILDSHGTPPLTQSLEWFGEIALALNAIHQAGLLHRDLKTSNILLRKDGTLALTDYGVEKRLLIDTGFLTEDEIFCTPYYVSPERITGEPCTMATDIYSLGVIFYELLLGKKPFDAGSLTELMTKHVLEPVPRLPEHLSQYQALLDGMLEKLPEYRFADVGAVLEQMEAI